MKLTRKSKIVIAVVATVVVTLAVFIAIPQAKLLIYGRPILKIGYYSYPKDFAYYLCDNGALFGGTTGYNSGDARFTYIRRLSLADLSALKNKLGQSFNVDQSTAPAPPKETIDFPVSMAVATYTGGGLMPRSISYQQVDEYYRLVSGFSGGITSQGGQSDTSYFALPGVLTPSVDCMPR